MDKAETMEMTEISLSLYFKQQEEQARITGANNTPVKPPRESKHKNTPGKGTPQGRMDAEGS